MFLERAPLDRLEKVHSGAPKLFPRTEFELEDLPKRSKAESLNLEHASAEFCLHRSAHVLSGSGSPLFQHGLDRFQPAFHSERKHPKNPRWLKLQDQSAEI